jgi:hypothetical protein
VCIDFTVMPGSVVRRFGAALLTVDLELDQRLTCCLRPEAWRSVPNDASRASGP